ncbi:MAG: hypothetical protein RLZZ09_650 [Pseudomonadota bacterium]
MKPIFLSMFVSLLVVVITSSGLAAIPTETAPPTGLTGTITPTAGLSETALEDAISPAPPFDPNPSGDPATTWQAISAGGMHSCGIHADGTLACWGDNSFGQLNAPAGQFISVSAGLVQSCAIRADGKLLCWGAAGAIPAKMPNGKFKDVSAGDGHACAIRHDDKVLCWGDKTWRQTKAPPGRYAALSAGGRHTCALRLDGRLVCWGEGSFMAYQRPPGRFRDITTGEVHACALRDDDRVLCWGNPTYGATNAPEGAFKKVVAGNFNTCGLGFDGTVKCWGRNELGETAVLVDERFKAISAGGAHGCGIRSDDTLKCWGSQSNEMIGEGLPGAGLQEVPYDFMKDLNGFLSVGLTLYGKGAEQKWTGPGARLVKFQMGLLGASVALSAVQAFMPQPPDPVAESLQRIEADIQELKAAVGLVDAKLNEIKARIDHLSCNVSIQPLTEAVSHINAASKEYFDNMERAKIILAAYAARASNPTKIVPNDGESFAKFVTRYKAKLMDDLEVIHTALVPGVSIQTGPLEECMIKKFNEWRAKGFDYKDNGVRKIKMPFDDWTAYYESIYEILAYAIASQGKALVMLQDINLWEAQQVLKNNNINYSPGELVGICANIREKAENDHDPSQKVWELAQVSCNGNTELAKTTYNRMVKQVERAGAAYTGKDTVLSFSSNLYGKGSGWADKSWLWVRDVEAYGDTQGTDWSSIQEPTRANPLLSDLPHYKWRAGGDAWLGVEDLVYQSVSSSFDLPEIMHDHAGFKNITNRIIWLDKPFEFSFNNLADFHSGGGSWGKDTVEKAEYNGRCFVASGIHSPVEKSKKNSEGIVCSERQLRYFVWNKGYGKSESGYSTFIVGTRLSDDNGYAKYANTLGELEGYWSASCGAISCDWNWYGLQTWPEFAQHPQRVSLTRWPVLDVASLKPTMSLVDKNAERKCTNAVNAPTRCGDDLDRIINVILPRPDSVQARVSLDERVKKVSIWKDSGSFILNCENFTKYDDQKSTNWLRSANYRWEYFSIETGKSMVEVGTDQSKYNYALRELSRGVPVPDPSSVKLRVRCGTEVTHAPTGVRYEVRSPWYSYTWNTDRLEELLAE